MTAPRVWAPNATLVELVVAGERRPMDAGEGGWHTARTAIDAGTDYAFSLDGGQPLPDPRSPWQPEGVHGPSRSVDHDAYTWADEGWTGFDLATAVLYELHVGTFSPAGTFEGVIDHLDHLTELGVTAIELLPVAEFPGHRGWGYDGVDLFAAHSAYGGPEGLKRLVDACHQRGLGVVLDVVYNHLGPAGNYLDRFGPYFTDRYATPWGAAVNLDGAGSDEVRRFFVDNALGWLEHYHLDGLRLDAVHAILDTSATHLLEQLAVEVDQLRARLGRRLWLIAESDLNDPRLVRPRDVGGYGLDAQWSDDFHHALHAALTGERAGYYADFGSLDAVAYALRNAFVYDGRFSAFRQRRHGRPATGLDGSRFVVCLQNHDQVGNRAAGERSSHLVPPELLMVGAALVLTSPFIPLLFQGEEWGASTPFQYFTDHQDPDLARAVSEGRRREFASFGWGPDDVPDPQDPATFERSKLRWDEPGRDPHARLLDWHRRLIALRRERPELRPESLEVVRARAIDARHLTVQRGRIVVAVNLSPVQKVVGLDHRDWRLLLGSDDGIRMGGTTLVLPATSVAIVEVSGS